MTYRFSRTTPCGKFCFAIHTQMVVDHCPNEIWLLSMLVNAILSIHVLLCGYRWINPHILISVKIHFPCFRCKTWLAYPFQYSYLGGSLWQLCAVWVETGSSSHTSVNPCSTSKWMSIFQKLIFKHWRNIISQPGNFTHFCSMVMGQPGCQVCQPSSTLWQLTGSGLCFNFWFVFGLPFLSKRIFLRYLIYYMFLEGNVYLEMGETVFGIVIKNQIGFFILLRSEIGFATVYWKICSRLGENLYSTQGRHKSWNVYTL